MYVYAQHFITLARIAHRKGVELKKAGRYDLAFVKFAERKHLMQLARS